jgi:outer membrane protein assembly factor BamD (BamD/ComL family)
METITAKQKSTSDLKQKSAFALYSLAETSMNQCQLEQANNYLSSVRHGSPRAKALGTSEYLLSTSHCYFY